MLEVDTEEQQQEQINKSMFVAYSVTIKARHLLDQGLTRAMYSCFGRPNGFIILQTNFPEAGDEAKLRQKLKSALLSTKEDKPINDAIAAAWKRALDEDHSADEPVRKVWQKVKEAQLFSSSSGWLSQLVVISNEAKHEEQHFPSPHEMNQGIVQWDQRQTVDFDHILFFRLSDSSFRKYSFMEDITAPGLTQEEQFQLSTRVLVALEKEKLLKTKGKFGTAEKKLLAMRSAQEIEKKLKCILPKDDSALLDLPAIAKRLWNHCAFCLEKPFEQSVFFRHIPVIPFLLNALKQVDAFLRDCALNIHAANNNKDEADP